jgi:hypothetical protein
MNDSFQPGDEIDLAEDLEASGDLQNEMKLQLFACACCRLIWDKLPPLAQAALLVGEDFSNGLVLPERLETERVKLWNFLGEESCNFSLPRVNAVRAVICCLFARNEVEVAYDHVRAVMEFCNDVEDHQREQYGLLRKVFAGDGSHVET